MFFDQNCRESISVRGITSAERVMWICPDRVFYAGLLGTPTARNYGCLTVYVAFDAPVRISIGGGEWQAGDVAVVQPYTSHRVACDARHVISVMVEPESVDMNRLPDWIRLKQGVIQADALRDSVHRAHQMLVRKCQQVSVQPLDFDALIFGACLATRTVDPRIDRVLERIRDDPSSPALAQDCADHVHLSFSRFLHLFKSEVGAPFRSFRTWKRARSLLHYMMDQRSTLTDVALGAGYPDSTHFSHSVRQIYGLKPKDMFAGSRKLRVMGPGLPTNQ